MSLLRWLVKPRTSISAQIKVLAVYIQQLGKPISNWCMILHVHKNKTDALQSKSIANEFVSRNNSHMQILGYFSSLKIHSVKQYY